MEYARQAAAWPVPDWTATQPMQRLNFTEPSTMPLPRLPAARNARRPRIIAFIPTHNEAGEVGPAIESLLGQTRRLDQIIVMPNGCVDGTMEVVSRYPVTVWELPRDPHKKAGVLNKGWNRYARGADLVVCIDGDTVLPDFAVEHWEKEMEASPLTGGISSQPVMTGNSVLSRIQRAEFAESATLSLRRGWCRVVSGTGCMFRNEALREASLIEGQDGPWTYLSVVEDYHLTFQLRKMGWLCVMSPTVYCFTGSMTTIRALWHQRIKWQSGTIGDLINFGFNRLNWREWMQQGFGLICVVFWVLWLTYNGAEVAHGHLIPNWSWLFYPAIFSVVESVHAWRIHGRDWKDMLLAATLIKALAYTWISMAWILASWWVILRGSTKDLWNAQYVAEGMEGENDTGTGGGPETQEAADQRGPLVAAADGPRDSRMVRGGSRHLTAQAGRLPASGEGLPGPVRHGREHPGAGLSRDEQRMPGGGGHMPVSRPGVGQHRAVHRRDDLAGPGRLPHGNHGAVPHVAG
jgi:cellulose synthase/poly-beta-1,6-N-acetylglucosamine synthase-like glycosyltransferase